MASFKGMAIEITMTEDGAMMMFAQSSDGLVIYAPLPDDYDPEEDKGIEAIRRAAAFYFVLRGPGKEEK